jgi:hypothetical protein
MQTYILSITHKIYIRRNSFQSTLYRRMKHISCSLHFFYKHYGFRELNKPNTVYSSKFLHSAITMVFLLHLKLGLSIVFWLFMNLLLIITMDNQEYTVLATLVFHKWMAGVLFILKSAYALNELKLPLTHFQHVLINKKPSKLSQCN